MKRRPLKKNGDFTDHEVRVLVADYCREITLGYTGWGVPFNVWVELKGIARFENGQLIREEKPTCSCEMCDIIRDNQEEFEHEQNRAKASSKG